MAAKSETKKTRKPRKKKVPEWVRKQELAVSNVRVAYDELGRKLEAQERAIQDKITAAETGEDHNNQSVQYTNSDQRQHDALVAALTSSHKKMANAMGYRSAHEILDIIAKGIAKAYNGEGHV
jgi:GDP-D-mannose dehydratase